MCVCVLGFFACPIFWWGGGGFARIKCGGCARVESSARRGLTSSTLPFNFHHHHRHENGRRRGARLPPPSRRRRAGPAPDRLRPAGRGGARPSAAQPSFEEPEHVPGRRGSLAPRSEVRDGGGIRHQAQRCHRRGEGPREHLLPARQHPGLLPEQRLQPRWQPAPQNAPAALGPGQGQRRPQRARLRCGALWRPPARGAVPRQAGQDGQRAWPEQGTERGEHSLHVSARQLRQRHPLTRTNDNYCDYNCFIYCLI